MRRICGSIVPVERYENREKKQANFAKFGLNLMHSDIASNIFQKDYRNGKNFKNSIAFVGVLHYSYLD
jgi:hypothetical protein